MFKVIKIINFFCLAVSIAVLLIFGLSGFFIYFILCGSLITYMAMKRKGITKYIKLENPLLYEKRKMVNKMTMDCEDAINLLALTKSEIDSLSDKSVREYITGVKEFFKLTRISIFLLIIIAAGKYLLK